MSVVRVPASSLNLNSNQYDVDFFKEVQDLEPEATPLCRLLTLAGDKVRKVTNPKFYHFEDQFIAWNTTVGTTYSAAAATIAVTTGDIFKAGDIVQNQTTGEQFRVTSVSSNTLTVTMSEGGTADSGGTAGDVLVRLGTSFAENTTSPDPLLQLLSDDYNFTQIFKTTFGIGRTAQQTKMRISEGELSRQRMLKGKEHKLDMERQFLFGKRGTTGTDSPRRTTRGAIAFLTANTASATTLTENVFSDWLANVFRYGSGEKVLLSSSIFITAMEYWGKGRLRGEEAMTEKLGMRIKRYCSAHGDFLVMKHKLFEVAPYTGYALALDPAAIKMATMQTTILQTNIQENDRDGIKEQYLTEAGLDMYNASKHGIFTGVTAYA